MLRIRRGPYRVPQSEESLRLAEELAERLEAQERPVGRTDPRLVVHLERVRLDRTPQPVLDRLNRELVRIVKSPGFAERVEPLGFEARATTREEFARFNADEIGRWGRIVRGLGLKVDQ